MLRSGRGSGLIKNRLAAWQRQGRAGGSELDGRQLGAARASGASGATSSGNFPALTYHEPKLPAGARFGTSFSSPAWLSGFRALSGAVAAS